MLVAIAGGSQLTFLTFLDLTPALVTKLLASWHWDCARDISKMSSVAAVAAAALTNGGFGAPVFAIAAGTLPLPP